MTIELKEKALKAVNKYDKGNPGAMLELLKETIDEPEDVFKEICEIVRVNGKIEGYSL